MGTLGFLTPFNFTDFPHLIKKFYTGKSILIVDEFLLILLLLHSYDAPRKFIGSVEYVIVIIDLSLLWVEGTAMIPLDIRF